MSMEHGSICSRRVRSLRTRKVVQAESNMAATNLTMLECKDCKRLFTNLPTFNSHDCFDPDSGGYDPDTLFGEELPSDTSVAATIGDTTTADDTPATVVDTPTAADTSASTGDTIASTSGDSESTVYLWTRTATLLLIDLYKSNETLVTSGKLRKKALWAKISKSMKEKNPLLNMTPAQCEGRWKTLVRGLKKVVDHNKKSGNDKKFHPYEDELAFITERPNISPEYVYPPVDQSSSDNASTPDTKSCKSTDDLEPSAKKRKPKSSASEIIDVMNSFIATQNARYEEESRRAERMHNERISIFKDFLSVLKPKE